MGLDQWLYIVTEDELNEYRLIIEMPDETPEEKDLKYVAFKDWYDVHDKEESENYRYWRNQFGTNASILNLKDLYLEDEHTWSFQSDFGTYSGYLDESFPNLKGTNYYYLYTITY